MQYEKDRFAVPRSGRSPDDCAGEHWADSRGRCVQCGEKVKGTHPNPIELEPVTVHQHDWSDWEATKAEDRSVTVHRRWCMSPGCGGVERFTVPSPSQLRRK